MHVLLIAPYYDQTVPGESWSTYKWVQGISERCETTVLTTHRTGWNSELSPTKASRLINWPDLALPKHFGRLNHELKPSYVLFYHRVRQWLKAELRRGCNFDLIHQINPLALRYPCPAVGFGIKYIIGPLAGSIPTPEGFVAECKEGLWYRRLRSLDALRFRYDPFLRASYRRASLLLGVAPYVRTLLAAMEPIRCYESIAETGVETVPEQPGLHRSHGGPVRLLFVGRVIRTKGLLDGIRALAIAALECDLRLDVIGDGDNMDLCRTEAAKLGVATRVCFHGRLNRAEVLEWYKRSDLFLFPSFREPSGNVVFEALGSGLPVITASNGGPGHVVDDSCGIRVNPTCPVEYARDLAKAIIELANSPERRAQMSKGAIRRMQHIGLWRNKCDLLLENYRRIQDR